eukprot:scaffold112_cov196-Amphora_coffeaeformis.AAC.6
MCRPDNNNSASSEPPGTATPPPQPPASHHNAQRLQHGFNWGAASLALWLLASNLSLPYTQDKRNALGCDAQCQGTMNAARSTLTLVGATVVGRLSDAPWLAPYGGGRRVCLWGGLLATAISLVWTSQASSLSLLWQSLVPHVLQQNLHVIKALFSDYHAQLDSSSAQRASKAGLLGMVGGFAMMLGPLIGSSLLNNIHQATAASLLALGLAALCVAYVPNPSSGNRDKKNDDDDNNNNKSSSSDKPQRTHFWSMVDVPAARSPAALFLLACRLLSTLAFHIFSTISIPSMKQRFEFGPTEYGHFFSFVGFCYAVSQYAGPFLLRRRTADASDSFRKHVFCGAVATIGMGRYLALGATHVYAMYMYYAVTVLATGVQSTLFAADTSHVAPPDQAGAFYGVVATMEAGSGMVGPLLGGALTKWNVGTIGLTNDAIITAPMVVTTGLSALVVTMVWFGYEPVVLSKLSKKKVD